MVTTVKVKMPPDTGAVTLDGHEQTVDSDGNVTVSPAQAAHLVESFGGKVVPVKRVVAPLVPPRKPTDPPADTGTGTGAQS